MKCKVKYSAIIELVETWMDMCGHEHGKIKNARTCQRKELMTYKKTVKPCGQVK